MRDIGVRLRDLDLRGGALHLLRLDRAIDRDEHLALADPVAGIDADCRHAAAFANHTYRQVAARSQRTGRGDLAIDGALARRDHGDARQLGLAAGVFFRARPGDDEIGHDRKQQGKDRSADVQRRRRVLRSFRRIERRAACHRLYPLRPETRLIHGHIAPYASFGSQCIILLGHLVQDTAQ